MTTQTTKFYVDPVKRGVPFDVTVDDMVDVRVIRREGEQGIIAVASVHFATQIMEALNAKNWNDETKDGWY